MTNTKRKGDRREREAKQLLKEIGYLVHKKVNNRYDSGDIFEKFDLLALKPNKKFLLIQVKSNQTQGALKELREFCRNNLEIKNIVPEVWVAVDNKGWRVYRLKHEDIWGYDVIVDETKKSCCFGDQIKEKY